MSRADLDSLPALPRDKEGPVFAEPWQAQAFAMTLKLHEAGQFTWPEWAAALSQEIADAKTRGEADLGDRYYHHWLAALETLLQEKQLLGETEMARRKQAWAAAAEAAPHGSPIELAQIIAAEENR